MSLSLKKRIAFHFILATAIVVATVFGIVYFIVQQTVYKNMDADLSFEANKHTKEILFTEKGIRFINKGEWEESEHKEVQVNPVFIELTDLTGAVMDKSPNLKEDQLTLQDQKKFGNHFSTKLKERFIRQVQIPVVKKGELNGYIVAAMSLDNTLMVLENLRFTLLLSFPIVLIGLFIISSFLAGRSISPVVLITNTANRITKNNLNERIDLPMNKDELYDLSNSINSLLNRLEKALEREKQFASDASHELRTPLAILRGTLEVLIRKDRSIDEYREKIAYCLTEIDRMAEMTDQLLLLARLDLQDEVPKSTSGSVLEIVEEVITHHQKLIGEKDLEIELNNTSVNDIVSSKDQAQLILENIIHNALKYSYDKGKIEISFEEHQEGVKCTIKDHGIGIKEKDLQNLFTPFFRSDALNHKDIKGVGLGLSIAQKAANVVNAEVQIESKFGKGTEVQVYFKEILR